MPRPVLVIGVNTPTRGESRVRPYLCGFDRLALANRSPLPSTTKRGVFRSTINLRRVVAVALRGLLRRTSEMFYYCFIINLKVVVVVAADFTQQLFVYLLDPHGLTHSPHQELGV